MTNNVVELLKGVVGELREISRSETIIGQPITVGQRTVIPVVKISVGFGAGGGQGEEEKKGSGFGGGGGGGAKIEPAAFIIMDDRGVSLLPAVKGKWGDIIDAIPDFARKFSEWTEKFKSEKDKEQTESSEDETEASEK
ncbi:MAG: sporulation protein [Candidatus Zixiibacteriota bacterium]|nr:MAG: sporulation protein [candidate division Zixibacteria bacterium]